MLGSTHASSVERFWPQFDEGGTRATQFPGFTARQLVAILPAPPTVLRARKEITWTFGRRIGMRCEAR